MVFLIVLVLQLYILQVVVHSLFRHIEHEAAEAGEEPEESRPNHQDAMAELATATANDSGRSSRRSARSSTGGFRFERYRQIIAYEVEQALLVKWQRFKVITWLKVVLLKCFACLPRSVMGHNSIKRLHMHLSRSKNDVETEMDRRHRQAISFMRYAKMHRNILTICTLRRGSKFVSLQFYLAKSTEYYRFFMIAIVLFHCILQAFEPTRGQMKAESDKGMCLAKDSRYVTPIYLSLGCILVELIDVVGEFWITYSEHQVTKELVNSKGKRNSIRGGINNLLQGQNLLESKMDALRRTFRAVVLLIISLDWLLLAAFCSANLITYYVPLRPVLLLLTSASLSSTVASIFATLRTRGMRSVGICFMVFWILAAMCAATLLRKQGNGLAEGCQDSHPTSTSSTPTLDSDSALNAFSFTSMSFTSIIPSLISTFILIATGENYVEVVTRPLFCSTLAGQTANSTMPWRASIAVIYFIILSLVGLIMLVGMFIGVFQDGFATQRRNEIQRTKLYERVGAIVAFSLLDHDGNSKVSLNQFKDFVVSLEKNLEMTSVLSAEGLFRLLHEEGSGAGEEEDEDYSDEEVLVLTDFVFKLYLITLIGVTFQRKEEDSASSPMVLAMRVAYEHPSHLIQKLVKFTLILHLLLACMYGLLTKEAATELDQVLASLLILEVTEVAVKLAVYGVRRFWNCAQYNAARTFEQWENRTALIVSAGVLVSYLISRGNPDSIALGFSENSDVGRMILVMPTVRLFFVLRTARRIIFVLVPLRLYIVSIVSLMFVFALIWAILGVALFEGVLGSIAEALDPGVMVGSFDSVGLALLTLTQVLIGEGWHNIMIATMNGRHSWYWAIYFIFYVVVQYLLLTNLLVGVILDSTSGFEEDNVLQHNVAHGDELTELDQLRQGYADVTKRRTSLTNREDRISIVAAAAPLGGLEVVTGAHDGHRMSVVLNQPTSARVSPQDAASRPKPFQLLPQLTKKLKKEDFRPAKPRQMRLSYSNLEGSHLPNTTELVEPRRSVTERRPPRKSSQPPLQSDAL